MNAGDVVRIGVPFVWLGAVLAISFLEAPLKFRAPGITVPLGLGIGRLVFRALNVAELAFAVILTVAVAAGDARSVTPVVVLLVALWALLAVQLLGLRPRLDRRARDLLAGRTPPRSRLHLGYIAAEAVKAVLLLALATVLVLTG